MKIPKKLKLFEEVYKIKKITQKQMDKLDKEIIEGLFLPDKKQFIFVNNKNIEDTFWHEIGHYFFQTFGYKDNEQNAQIFSEFIRSIIKQIK